MSQTRKLLVFTAIVAWAVMLGCERDSGSTNASGSGTPAPPATAPANRPLPRSANGPAGSSYAMSAAATSLARSGPPSYLFIKDLSDPNAPESPDRVLFPAARLRITSKADEPVVALLFSDDPKEAMNKDWTGDRYYFSLTFQQNADPRHLDGAAWYCTASENEKEETANGIFLHGDQVHLEPLRAMITCEGDAQDLRVKIAGEFLAFDTTSPDAKPHHCQVTGVLAPRVEIK